MKNALKFTQSGRVKIYIGYDEHSEMLQANVVDSGKGITDSEMPNLFKLFGKLKRTADMNHEGIGMGLMIVNKLVNLSEGTITVHSDGPDKGATFSFTMKMRKGSISGSRKRKPKRKHQADKIHQPSKLISMHGETNRISTISSKKDLPIEEAKVTGEKKSNDTVDSIENVLEQIGNEKEQHVRNRDDTLPSFKDTSIQDKKATGSGASKES